MSILGLQISAVGKRNIHASSFWADVPAAITNLQNLIEDNNRFLLFQALEKAKIDLSSYEEQESFGFPIEAFAKERRTL